MPIGRLSFRTLGPDFIRDRWLELEALSFDSPEMSWQLANYQKQLPRKWELSRLVYDGDELIGYFLCSARGRLLWLHRLVVGAGHRRNGHGATMADQICSLAAQQGFKGVALKTLVTNESAIRFYEQLGFTRLPDSGQHAVFLRLNEGAELLVAIHQPNYLPWQGYFYKMSLADVFIFLDDVTFQRGTYVNRSRFCISGLEKWLTAPLRLGIETRICDAKVADNIWPQKHLRSIELSYSKARYMAQYFPELSSELLAAAKLERIDLINTHMNLFIAGLLNLNPIVYKSSDLGVAGTGDERLINLTKLVRGHAYVSGSGGANYQAQPTFDRANLRLLYSNFRPEPYDQKSKSFLPGISAIDAILNVGTEEVYARFKSLSETMPGVS